MELWANPRVQFRMDSQDATIKEALNGKKVGDSSSVGENKFDLKILEIYSIVEPQAEASTAQTESPAEAAPAAEIPVAEAPTQAAAPLPELPAETPVVQFVSDAGSVVASA